MTGIVFSLNNGCIQKKKNPPCLLRIMYCSKCSESIDIVSTIGGTSTDFAADSILNGSYSSGGTVKWKVHCRRGRRLISHQENLAAWFVIHTLHHVSAQWLY